MPVAELKSLCFKIPWLNSVKCGDSSHLGLLRNLMGSAAPSENQDPDTTWVQEGAPNSVSAGDVVPGRYLDQTQGTRLWDRSETASFKF